MELPLHIVGLDCPRPIELPPPYYSLSIKPPLGCPTQIMGDPTTPLLSKLSIVGAPTRQKLGVKSWFASRILHHRIVGAHPTQL